MCNTLSIPGNLCCSRMWLCRLFRQAFHASCFVLCIWQWLWGFWAVSICCSSEFMKLPKWLESKPGGPRLLSGPPEWASDKSQGVNGTTHPPSGPSSLQVQHPHLRVALGQPSSPPALWVYRVGSYRLTCLLLCWLNIHCCSSACLLIAVPFFLKYIV